MDNPSSKREAKVQGIQKRFQSYFDANDFEGAEAFARNGYARNAKRSVDEALATMNTPAAKKLWKTLHKPRRNRLPIIIGIVLLLVVVVVGAIFVFRSGSLPNTAANGETTLEQTISSGASLSYNLTQQREIDIGLATLRISFPDTWTTLPSNVSDGSISFANRSELLDQTGSVPLGSSTDDVLGVVTPSLRNPAGDDLDVVSFLSAMSDLQEMTIHDRAAALGFGEVPGADGQMNAFGQLMIDFPEAFVRITVASPDRSTVETLLIMLGNTIEYVDTPASSTSPTGETPPSELEESLQAFSSRLSLNLTVPLELDRSTLINPYRVRGYFPAEWTANIDSRAGLNYTSIKFASRSDLIDRNPVLVTFNEDDITGAIQVTSRDPNDANGVLDYITAARRGIVWNPFNSSGLLSLMVNGHPAVLESWEEQRDGVVVGVTGGLTIEFPRTFVEITISSTDRETVHGALFALGSAIEYTET